MKKRKLFGKSTKTAIMGVFSDEYICVKEAIIKEYVEAHARQKTEDAAPSKYMLGLAKAIEIMDSVQPHVIAGV